MIRLLALDTSSKWGGVALVERKSAEAPARVEAEIGAYVSDSHAEHVLLWIEHLLGTTGWPRSSLDAFAAIRGPGSFTGIRVALGTLRGLALATGRPAVGVSGLAALAEAAGPAESDRLCLIDAGRGELYGARFDAGSSPPVGREEPWIRSREAALAAFAGCVLVPGPGTVLDAAGPGSRALPSPLSLAAAAGRLALAAPFPTSESEADLAPLYLRPPDALVRRRSR